MSPISISPLSPSDDVDAGEDERAAGKLQGVEVLAEEQRGEEGRQGSLGEQADGDDRGGKVAECVCDAQVRADLGDDAEPEQRDPGVA